MGIGVSLILIAVGAILTWAVNATVSGVDINAVGVILMIVGAVGLLLSLMFWSSWGGYGVARADGARHVRSRTARPPPGLLGQRVRPGRQAPSRPPASQRRRPAARRRTSSRGRAPR